jgi:hypothetical protein
MSNPSSDDSGDVARDETTGLIASDKVVGADVYDSGGEKIGAIETLMLGKSDGRIAYAVLSFGAALVTKANYYPVPWSSLTYDTGQDGYVVGLSKQALEDAPNFDRTPDWHERHRGWSGEVDAFFRRA